MNTFISYSTKIKKTAGKIKKYLDEFDFHCFLAHEDIPPQTEWPSEIIKALKNCNLFLPLLSQGFIESLFCQQETGFAFGRKINILPVMINKSPMGMIANIQAIRFNKEDFESSCWKIVKHVGNTKSLSKPVLDSLVKWFGSSDSYDTAATRAKMILNEFSYNHRQVIKIKDHIKNNSQINQTKEARDSIFKFMNKHSNSFDAKFLKWYDSKDASRMWMR